MRGLLENLTGNAFDLDVHLQSGNSVFSSGYLEVHIAEVVFHTLNVGQNGVFAALVIHDQTHRNTGYRRLDRNTCRHQRHRAGADGGLRRRTVGFGNVRYRTDRVREFFYRRKNFGQCAFA